MKKRSGGGRRGFFLFFFFFNFDSKSTYVPVVTTVNRFYIFATFNDLKLVVCAKLATGHGDFFVRKANQLRWKEFRRVALSLVFSIRSLLLLLTPPILHSVFIQDERFDKTENLHDVNPSPLFAFSDNWLPSFSFRVSLVTFLCKKMYELNPCYVHRWGGETIKKINKLRLHRLNLHTRFSMLKAAILPVFVPILVGDLVLPSFFRREISLLLWKIWKIREGKIRSSWKS